MPKPPVLPQIDWKAVFDSGQSYEQWIQSGESEENRAAMQQQLGEQYLPAHVEAALKALPRTVHVIAIAEDWCGDVVRHVPVLQRLAQAGDRLQVRYITREQHPDVFARFLTNGGEAIPKFVFLSQEWVECGAWGPMPAAERELISRGKACGDVAAAREKVAKRYEADADKREVAVELMALVDIAACERV